MKIYNTLTNQLEEFKSLEKGQVKLYVCGITPYDTTHLGHAFTYISFDALFRYLQFKGYKVVYTQNVTDINDRDKDILERAKKLNIPWQDLAKFWTDKFLQDMKNLNWVMPTNYLWASQNIDPMVGLIQKLLDHGLAYQVGSSVFLEVAKFPDFGKLSGFNRQKMLKVAKDFEEDLDNPDKKDPLDITLWRGATPDQAAHIPSFKSPFGEGRPGWHIECSAMSIYSLGEQIDIHGGGKDLIYPHHEAEIAQSEGATGKTPFVKYWLHNGQVSFQGQKISKSKGNLVLVSDLLKKYSPDAIRFLLLSHHYREGWEYFEKDLEKAQQQVDLIVKSFSDLSGESDEKLYKAFLHALDNDFNSAKALKILIKMASEKDPKLLAVYKLLGFKTI